MLVAGVTGWGFFAVLCTTTATRRVMLLLQPVIFIPNNPEFSSKNLIELNNEIHNKTVCWLLPLFIQKYLLEHYQASTIQDTPLNTLTGG